MFEGEGPLRHQAHLVEQLGSLKVREVPLQYLIGQLGDRLHQRHGYLRTDHGGYLEEGLRRGGQPVEACCQHRMHRCRHRYGRGSQAMFHRMPRQLFEKKRIARPVRDNLLAPCRLELGRARHGRHNGLALLHTQGR